MVRKLALLTLCLMLAGLQWRLWLGEGGVVHTQRLQAEAQAAREDNERLRLHNVALDAEVRDLNSGQAAIESRARMMLGMIKPTETFFLVVE